MFTRPNPDRYLSAADVRDVAEEVISPLPLPGVEGTLDTGDIWAVVILACVRQNSIWDACNDTDGTPCDDTVLTWLHTLNCHWLEFVVNLLLGRLTMTILGQARPGRELSPRDRLSACRYVFTPSKSQDSVRNFLTPQFGDSLVRFR